MILLLIPKDNTNTRSIGLLETLWKGVEAIIYTLLRASISFYDILHGFPAGRAMGTTILELKLSQELASVNQGPLFLVFMDFPKAYDTMDRGRLLTNLEGYGASPQMRGILAEFWGTTAPTYNQVGRKHRKLSFHPTSLI